jgi:hypothetical protein
VQQMIEFCDTFEFYAASYCWKQQRGRLDAECPWGCFSCRQEQLSGADAVTAVWCCRCIDLTLRYLHYCCSKRVVLLKLQLVDAFYVKGSHRAADYFNSGWHTGVAPRGQKAMLAKARDDVDQLCGATGTSMCGKSVHVEWSRLQACDSRCALTKSASSDG